MEGDLVLDLTCDSINTWLDPFLQGDGEITEVQVDNLAKGLLVELAKGLLVELFEVEPDKVLSQFLCERADEGDTKRHRLLRLFVHEFSIEFSIVITGSQVMKVVLETWSVGDSGIFLANELLVCFLAGRIVTDGYFNDETWWVTQHWNSKYHIAMPLLVRKQIETILMINRFKPDSVFALLPKDMLFYLFGWIAVAHSDTVRKSYDDLDSGKKYGEASYQLGPYPRPWKKP